MNLLSTSISLYVHIPFCSSKCKYCDFYSETSGFNRITGVVDQLIAELEYHYYKLNKPNIETVFIGGGTPSLISNRELERLFKSIQVIAPKVKEWTIESNPESITKEFLKTCSTYGVTRLSIGIQSFNDKLLKILGRKANNSDITRAMDLVRKFWRKSFSLDLISSIPEQSVHMVTEDINRAIGYNPDHISFYGLSLEEGTPLENEVSRGIITDLDTTTSDNIWLTGRALLREHGYNDYEVSNYTKNSPSLHNSNYWELKPYLGIGPGAVSTLIDDTGHIVRISNRKSINLFLKGQGNKWGEEYTKISPKEFLDEYIMMGLRLRRGIDMARFEKVFNKSISDIIPISNELQEEGLIIINKGYYALSSRAYDIMNSIIIRIFKSLEGIDAPLVNWFF
ncbi:MAG: hypothetical protein B6229_01380 [Spirochaetaceae bacterium 4572_7]|nr:MAG: hypothetical protein B6229_01380 [Spirochaetaceae bacterium 4572_7]